ncbi:hypothetical protein REPUB_Repub03eG0059700 [Reevesia pubescens]
MGMRSRRVWEERNFFRNHGVHDRSKGSKNSFQNFDWRLNLHSMYVENLSTRISREALWEAFSSYGRVVDKFISKSLLGKGKSFTFVFLRFKLESEAVKDIEEGNQKKMDCHIIGVKKAFRTGNKIQKFNDVRMASSSNDCEQSNGKHCDIVQEGKSDKDALLGVTLSSSNHVNMISGGIIRFLMK